MLLLFNLNPTMMKSDVYEYEKYVTDPDSVMETLQKYGVAIIPGVLTEAECTDMVDKIWDFFERLSSSWYQPIDRENEESWRGFYKLYPKHSMLFQNWCVGHSHASWDVRQNEKVVHVFSKIWDVKPEELLVSFDGFSFNPPPEITNKGWNRNNTWYHSDQSFTRNGFECVQSWVTGLDVEEGDATLSFYEGSHKFHKELADRFGITDKADWKKLKKEEEAFYLEKGCAAKKIQCPKGSMVLWDSRTIHCGTEAFRMREHSKFRAVIYVCYEPRSHATAAHLRKKRKAFHELRGTSHWPAKSKLFPWKPRTYGGEIPEITLIDPPILTGLGKKLAGF